MLLMPKELIYHVCLYNVSVFIMFLQSTTPLLFAGFLVQVILHCKQEPSWLGKREKSCLHIHNTCAPYVQHYRAKKISSSWEKWDIKFNSPILRAAMLDAAVKHVGRGQGPIYVVSLQGAPGPLLYHAAKQNRRPVAP